MLPQTVGDCRRDGEEMRTISPEPAPRHRFPSEVSVADDETNRWLGRTKRVSGRTKRVRSQFSGRTKRGRSQFNETRPFSSPLFFAPFVRLQTLLIAFPFCSPFNPRCVSSFAIGIGCDTKTDHHPEHTRPNRPNVAGSCNGTNENGALMMLAPIRVWHLLLLGSFCFCGGICRGKEVTEWKFC